MAGRWEGGVSRYARRKMSLTYCAAACKMHIRLVALEKISLQIERSQLVAEWRRELRSWLERPGWTSESNG